MRFPVIMSIIYIVFTLVLSSFCIGLASDDAAGTTTTPFAGRKIAMGIHALILVCSTYYLGFPYGLIVFVCHLFSLWHATVGWLLSLPKMRRALRYADNPFLMEQVIKRDSLRWATISLWLLILYVVFFVISIIKVPYCSLRDLLTLRRLLIFAAVMAVFFVGRIISGRIVKKKYSV